MCPRIYIYNKFPGGAVGVGYTMRTIALQTVIFNPGYTIKITRGAFKNPNAQDAHQGNDIQILSGWDSHISTPGFFKVSQMTLMCRQV